MNFNVSGSWNYVLLNYYAILGVNENASMTEIKKRYKCLILQHHPDKINSKTASTEENLEFARLLTAIWSTLSDETKKEKYDQKLKQSNVCQNVVIGDVINYKELEMVGNCIEGVEVPVIEHSCRCGELCIVLEYFEKELMTVLGCESCSQLILVTHND